MNERAKISITLPGKLLHQVDRLRRTTGETRSEFFRRAIAALLREGERQREICRYLAGYHAHPETEAELSWVAEASEELLATELWE